MTTKEKVLQCKHQNPSWGYSLIGKHLNLAKNTVKFHLSEKERARHAAFRQSNRKKQIIELKMLYGGKCSRCGYGKCLDALHFHHPDPTIKEGTVARLFTDKSKRAAFSEAIKCQLVCANCHAELHAD